MEEALRTSDPALRLARQDALRRIATAAEAFLVDRAGGYYPMVSGSLSRGQVHPWSDLDLILEETVDITDEQRAVRSDLKYDLVRHIDQDDVDFIFLDEIAPALAKGMLGSMVRPQDTPPLADLPDARIILARLHVSIGFVLRASEEILSEYLENETKLRSFMSDFESSAYSNAMDPLRRKSTLWMRKLAVFLDGGRSEWLDDWADEDALDRLLVRLAIPGSAPDGVSSVLDPSSAAALRYLLVDAYDFVVRRRTADSPKDEYQSVFDAVKGMEAKLAGMTSGVETHGLIR